MKISEIKDVFTVEEIWEQLEKYALEDTLTYVVLANSKVNKFSKEETAIFLAFEALKKVEILFEELEKIKKGLCQITI